MSDSIRIHQYSDGPTGHVNVEFFRNGTSLGIYGSNTTGFSGFGLAGGVYNETDPSLRRIAENPGGHSFTDVNVSTTAFNSALSFAQRQASLTQTGQGDYNLVCRNCVDFTSSVLESAGMDRFSVSNYLVDGTLADIYANTVMYLCTNPYYDLMDSYVGGLGLEYMDQYYLDTFNLHAPWSFDMFWTAEYIDLYNHLRPMFGAANTVWDRYLNDLIGDYAANGSPIAIDLNGDGIKTISLSDSGVAFDITGDGRAERTGWLSGDDAFIVRDINSNGTIDGVGEMFGGMHRGEGYAKLSELDENGDGEVSIEDTAFATLMLWQDKNVDGKTDQDELSSLKEAGVRSLSLHYQNKDTWQQDNFLGETSTAHMNGLDVEMTDVYFRLGDEDLQRTNELLLQDMAAFQSPQSGDASLITTNHLRSANLPETALVVC